MRSHPPGSDSKSSRNLPARRARALLAVTAVIAACSLATAADAAFRMGSMGPARGIGTFGAGNLSKMTPVGSGRVVGSTGISSHAIGALGRGGGKTGGDKGGKGGGGDGGRVSTGDGGKDGGDRHPRPPHWRPPIITVVPPVLTTTAPALSAVGTGGSGGGSSNPSPGPQPPAGTSNGGPPASYVPDEVLTQMASSVSADIVEALGRRQRLDRIETFDANGVTMARWRIPDRRSVPAVIRSLQAERIVLAVQPNYFYRAQQQQAPADQPADTAVPAGDPGPQYAPLKLRLPQAHELATGEKVLVAVIDSGIDTSHPELAGAVAESYDALGSDDKVHAHGTAVAGAIVAHAQLMGAAPQARLLAARAFDANKDRTAEATTYSIDKALDWAVSRGARIINMSFEGPRDPSMEQRITRAAKQGTILIAAAGNNGPKANAAYPAAYPAVIAVTATDADDRLFKGANRGSYIAVAAPGVDLLLPAPAAGYQMTTGTSFAAAEVSGIAALLLERKPDLGPDGVRKALTATARALGPKARNGLDPQFGAGLVDAYAAIRAVAPAVAKIGPAAHAQ